MADIEKVIKGLESCLNNYCHMDKCPYCEFVGNEYVCLENFLMRDSLDLLKEQQQQIWELQDQVEYLTDKQKKKFLVDSDGKITPLPVVVRCKDCVFGKHEKNESTGKEWIYCGHHRENRPEDWFCASGLSI